MNAPRFTPQDEAAMRGAIGAARAAIDAGNRPYGAALVDASGAVVLTAGNAQETSGDCTAHAEMQLVREATARLGAAALRGATVHASGEPCAMCAGALFWAGVRRIVWAADWHAMATILGGDLLPARAADVLRGCTPAVTVEGPLLAEESIAVLREAARRQESPPWPRPIASTS